MPPITDSRSGVAGPQAGGVAGGHEGQDDAVVGRRAGDHHDVDQSPAGAPVGGAGQAPTRAVGLGAHRGRSGAAQVGDGDAGAGPSGGQAGAVPLHGRAGPPAVAQAESAPGDGLGHLVLGDDEPRRAARAAEQLDGLDAHPRVAAETAFLGRHGDGQLTGVGEQREVGRVDAAGRVVGGGGVRGEDVAGDPAHGADGGVGGDRRIGGEQGLDGGSGTRVHGRTLREHLPCGAAHEQVPHPAGRWTGGVRDGGVWCAPRCARVRSAAPVRGRRRYYATSQAAPREACSA